MTMMTSFALLIDQLLIILGSGRYSTHCSHGSAMEVIEIAYHAIETGYR